MFIRCFSTKRKTTAAPAAVYLNVYDLTPINGYAYWLGLGIFHSGVQVHGVEYAYGAHDGGTTGIFEVEPRQCPGFQYRKSILIGRTAMTVVQVRVLIDAMAEQYAGNDYNLISKNCNHFCDDLCQRLTGNSIPRWVNRLARLGSLCNCVLPARLNVEMIEASQPETERGKKNEGERPPLKNNSNKYANSHAFAGTVVPGNRNNGDGGGCVSRRKRNWGRTASTTALIGAVSALEYGAGGVAEQIPDT